MAKSNEKNNTSAIVKKESFDQAIGILIKTSRKHQGMTQKSLADKVGASDRTIRKLEKGIEYSDRLLLKVCHALNLDYDYVTNRGYDIASTSDITVIKIVENTDDLSSFNTDKAIKVKMDNVFIFQVNDFALFESSAKLHKKDNVLIEKLFIDNSNDLIEDHIYLIKKRSHLYLRIWRDNMFLSLDKDYPDYSYDDIQLIGEYRAKLDFHFSHK